MFPSGNWGKRRRDRLERSLATAQRQLESAREDARTRGEQELVAGAGAVLSILLGGRGNTRTVAGRAGRTLGGAAGRRGMKSRAEKRADLAAGKAADRSEDLRELEQEILDEVAEIDERWAATAEEVEELEIRLEASDVQVDEIALVWVPTA